MKKTLLSAFAILTTMVGVAQVTCSAGVLTSQDQVVCPTETANFVTDGSHVIPAAPGGYGIVFTPTTGTGGINAELTLYGVTLPYAFNSDLNGILSANSLPPFNGEWNVRGVAFTNNADIAGTTCDSTLTSFLVTFLSAADPLCGGSGGPECLTWVSPSPTTGWSDFNTAFGGAPVPVADVCPFNEIQDFEVWKSEAYAMDNMVAGSCYTFSHCNGPGAGSWVPDYTIIAPSGAIDAFGAGDGDGCSITWVASEAGTYLIVINEAGACGVGGQVNNGWPAITCNASTCGSISVEEVAATSFNIFPNPNAGQFAIDYTGVSGLATVEVIELSGKIVSNKQVSVTTGSRIDMNIGSVKGMYFVRITMNNASQVHKVVVN
jgi:hypothetical protein